MLELKLHVQDFDEEKLKTLLGEIETLGGTANGVAVTKSDETMEEVDKTYVLNNHVTKTLFVEEVVP